MAACESPKAPGDTTSDCAGSRSAQSASDWFERVGIYEIGRARPIPLPAGTDAPVTSRADDCGTGAGPADVFACSSIRPDAPSPGSSTKRLFGLALLEAGAALALSGFLLRLAAGPQLANARWLAAVLIAGVVAAIQLISPGLLAP